MDNMRSERGGSNTELEAAAFRKLLEHLDSRKDVQNIEPVSYTHLTLPTT